VALIRLIYTSVLVEHDADMLIDILYVAQNHNKQRNITGMLLRAKGNVLQVLEGEEEDVCKTFRSIELDQRHREVFVLSKQEIRDRHFDDWSMGFRQLNEADLGQHPIAAQVFDAKLNEITQRVRPGSSLALLALFAQVIEPADQG
jgi:hypothetical protein